SVATSALSLHDALPISSKQAFLDAAILRTIERQEADMWWTDYGPMPWMLFGPLMMLGFIIMCVAMMFFMMRGHRRDSGRPMDLRSEEHTSELQSLAYLV